MGNQASRPLPHKEKLLREGVRLIYQNGFNGTSIDGVLAAAEVPKGSFYHHFGSKDGFAKALVGRYVSHQASMLDDWLAKDGLSTAEKIVGHFMSMVDRFIGTGHQRACLVGKLSSEVSSTSELFRQQLSAALNEMKCDIVVALEAGQANGDVRQDRSSSDIADGIMALIQGAFVVALSTHDDHSLTAVGETIASIIEPPK
ncbi:TetR/AcrR family transcriptional regulator [Brevibacterium sp. UCMA 11754]|nr:TetR/AcrR family transcriptional regulator [Brevibacterium sp. UCMA 11754]